MSKIIFPSEPSPQQLNSKPRMKFSKRTVVTSVLIIVLALAGLLIYRMVSAPPDAGRKQLAPLVQTAKPRMHEVSRNLVFTGDVLARQQATIYSRVSGNVEKMFVDIGQYVQSGQLLAKIDATQFREQARQTAAALAQAQAPLEQVEATFARIKELYAKNLVSQQEYDASQATVRTVHAQVDVAKANYANANVVLSYCNIVAPFSGFITKRFLDPGAYVATAPQNNATLFTLMDLDKVKIFVNVLERDVPLVRQITQAHVTVDAYRDSVLGGVIAKSNEALDLGTRTLAVQVDVDNHNHLLKPGMFATVTFVTETHPNALTVPSGAVMSDDKGKFVYIVSDGKAHRAAVQTGLEENNEVEIIQGLSPDANIIILGQQLVKDDAPVRTAQ